MSGGIPSHPFPWHVGIQYVAVSSWEEARWWLAACRCSAAMDEFFSGLDSRLRMSMKVADSIMMGLVNAAMEDAYKKSLWKDGDLERLVQKLRFAQLAIMQLEWCLRFVRGEMESGAGADDGGHEQLLDDLLETRDRIQARLDEAELAVADKDRDYMRRKHEELRSSRREAALADSEPERARPAQDGEDGCALGYLRGSVDRQMARMRIRLEDARSTLGSLMEKVSGEASPMARLQEAGHEGDGVKGLSGFYSMAQLLMEFQDMVLDAGAVRDSVSSSFDAMERSICSLTSTIDEQRWLANAEKDMHDAIVTGFLREINTKDETVSLQSTSHIPETSDNGQCRHSAEEYCGISDEEVDILIEENIDSEIKCGLQDVLYKDIFRDLARNLAVQEEALKLAEEKDELNIRSRLQCETQVALFRDLVSELAFNSAEHLVGTFVKDEVHTVLVANTLNEWKIAADMVCKERPVKEEIVPIVLTKDLAQDHNLSVISSSNEDKIGKDLGRFATVDNLEQLYKIKINVSIEDKDVDSNQRQGPVQRDIFNTNDFDGKYSEESHVQAERSTEKNGVSDSVDSIAEQALEQEDHKKLQAGDVALNLSTSPEGSDTENGLVVSILDEKHGDMHSLAFNAATGENTKHELQNLLIPLTNFQKTFMDFEDVANGKIITATLRLRDLDGRLANLAEEVSSLKRTELVYRRAFTNRCHDLQTAETEVDMLGDEVELLLGLLSKTYKALDHYSPVLQHYIGVREMLELLSKELLN